MTWPTFDLASMLKYFSNGSKKRMKPTLFNCEKKSGIPSVNRFEQAICPSSLRPSSTGAIGVRCCAIRVVARVSGISAASEKLHGDMMSPASTALREDWPRFESCENIASGEDAFISSPRSSGICTKFAKRAMNFSPSIGLPAGISSRQAISSGWRSMASSPERGVCSVATTTASPSSPSIRACGRITPLPIAVLDCASRSLIAERIRS